MAIRRRVLNRLNRRAERFGARADRLAGRVANFQGLADASPAPVGHEAAPASRVDILRRLGRLQNRYARFNAFATGAAQRAGIVADQIAARRAPAGVGHGNGGVAVTPPPVVPGHHMQPEGAF